MLKKPKERLNKTALWLRLKKDALKKWLSLLLPLNANLLTIHQAQVHPQVLITPRKNTRRSRRQSKKLHLSRKNVWREKLTLKLPDMNRNVSRLRELPKNRPRN